MTRLRFRRRRAVSETIATLLILAITVAGAVLVANFMRDGFFDVNQNPSTDARVGSIQLTGYDTRDSESDALLDVNTVLNEFNQMLCTQGDSTQCTIGVPNDIPSLGGTDFIVLKIRNMNVDSVFLQNILVNNVGHKWDEGTANNVVDASVAGTAGTDYPKAGFFSITPTAERSNPLKQKATHELLGDEEVRVIIKLSNSINQDIEMWDSLRIHVNFGGPQPADFVVLSGDAKW